MAANYRHGIITYTGNGTSQSLSGLGFTPIAIILKRRGVVGALNGCAKTTSMPSTDSIPLAAAGVLTTGITSLDADGFSVGSNVRANQSGALYFALCFGVGSDNAFLRVGTYTGDGAASQAIVIASGYKPDYLLIIGNTENCWRSIDMTGDEAIIWKNSTKKTGLVLSMDANGFTVGSDGATNTGAQVYHFIAWKRASLALDDVFRTGTYVGTGANLAVDPGLTPAWFLAAHRVAGFDAFQRFSTYPANTSTGWGSTTDTTFGVRDFTSVEVGTFVSQSGITHHFVTMTATANVGGEIEFGDALDGRTVGLTWFELTDSGGTLQLGSTIPLADPVSYFGGFKEARVLTWARVQRALSDVQGRIEGGRFGFTLVDTDRKWRGILGTQATRALRRRPVVLRSIDDESRRLLLTPRTIARGIVQGYQPRAPFLFDFFCEDEFTQKFTTIQSDPRQVPKRRITTQIFQDAPRESFDLPVPIIYGRSTDFAGIVGAAQVTGVTAKGLAAPTAAPTGVTATAIAGGVASADVTRYYLVTGIVSGEETRLSAVVQATTTASLRSIRIDWTAVPGATTIFLYTSPVPNFFQPPTQVGIGVGRIVLAGGATTFTDTVVPPPGFISLAEEIGTSLIVSYFVWARLSDGSFSNAGRADINAFLDGTDISIAEKSFSPYGLPGRIRRARIAWSAFSGATGYKLIQWVQSNYLREGAFIFEFDFDASTLSFDHAFRVILGSDVTPPGFGGTAEGGPAEVITDELRGVVPTIHVGSEVISGTVYQRLLVCGHAVKEIQGVFRTGDEGGADFLEIPDSEFGSIWLSPFKPGWPFVDDFRDLPVASPTRRYTLIYTLIDPPPVTLVNVLGIETVGDGSGTLVESLYEQYLHFLQNWVLGDYRLGAYLATPTFVDEPTLKQIDEDSFATAKTISEARITGGYKGAVAFGSEGEFVTVIDALARWNLSGDVEAGFNAKFQYFLSLFEETALAGVPVHDDVLDVHDGSFHIEEQHESHFNIVPFAFARDYRLGEFHVRDQEVRSQTSIDDYGQELLAPLLNLFMVRDPVQALDIAGRRLRRFKNPPRLVTWNLALQGLSIELGDLLLLTHEQGVSATGWLRQPMRIVRHEVDPNDFTVTLQAWDVFDLFQTCFIFGDDTVQAASFVGASAEDQRYGYLCDEATEEFSDGSPGKRLC